MLHLFPCVLAVSRLVRRSPLHALGQPLAKVTANSLLLPVSGLPSTMPSAPVVLKMNCALMTLCITSALASFIRELQTSASCCLLPFPHRYLKSISDLTCCKHSSRRRQWQPTPVLLPGKSHGQRSLVGCSPWGLEESDTTEQLPFHFSLSRIREGNGNPLQCSCLENPRDSGAW